MKKMWFGLLVVLTTAVLAACTTSSGSSTKNEIKIGAKDFTENLIISEIYALALENDGYNVKRIPSIASSVIPQSIKKGEIDLYPEYTGTALLSIYKLPLETNPEKVANTIREAYKKDQLVALNYAPANDAQGIAITKKSADKYGIKTISDLQKQAPNIRFASQGEFDQREDGLVGLTKTYGPFNFKNSTIYDNSLKYQVLKNDKADATPAYTTEGPLSDKNEYLVLEDDKQFWPPYNVIPIVREETLKEFPKLEQTINHIDKQLDTETLINLNAKVDIDGIDYQTVAKEWYEAHK